MRKLFRTELRIPPVEEASGHVSYAEAKRSMERRDVNALETLLRHPDERVLLDLTRDYYDLVDPNIHHLQTIEWNEAKRQLITRIYKDAETEGVLWTPLIDAAVMRDGIAHQVVVQEPLRQIAAWAEDAKEADLRWLMRSFEASPLRETVARVARNITPDLAREWVESGMLRFRSELCRNPALSSDVIDTLASVFISEIRARVRGEVVSDSSFVALAHMFRGGHSVPIHFLKELFTLVPLVQPDLKSLGSVSTDLAWFADQIVSALPGITEEELLVVVGAADVRSPWLEKAVRHEAAGGRVWRHVLQQSRSWQLKAEIAKRSEARKDPTLQELLLSSNAAEVLVEMVEDLPPPRFIKLVRRVVARRPELALRALERARSDQLEQLEMEDLYPLFQSENRDIRLAATLILAKLKEARDQEPTREGRRLIR